MVQLRIDGAITAAAAQTHTVTSGGRNIDNYCEWCGWREWEEEERGRSHRSETEMDGDALVCAAGNTVISTSLQSDIKRQPKLCRELRGEQIELKWKRQLKCMLEIQGK